MTKIFLHIVNMSISAGYVVLAVLLLRLLFKRAPKWITAPLWGIVALRLICPFSFESPVSLIPSNEIISTNIMMEERPEIDTGISIIDDTINPVISENFAPVLGDSVNPMQVWITVFTWVWLIGIVFLTVYIVVSYVKIKRRICTAVLFKDNIYQSENVVSPFVFGFIKPRIYLPFNVDENQMFYIVAHEQQHIHRKDYIWKVDAFVLLSVYWFNPLIWVSYILFSRDIEFACDEKVIKTLDSNARANYSEALLAFSVCRITIKACPIAFGEVSVKKRIKTILHYKKPAFWIIMSAATVCVIVAICFLTNPISKSDEQNTNYRYSLPLSCTRKLNGKTISLKQNIDYTDEGQQKIVSLLSKGESTEQLGECGYDYEFVTPNETIQYCSQCGHYLEVQGGEVYALQQDDMVKLNKNLGAHRIINVNNNVYEGWQGEFSEDKYLTTIQEYSKSYTPIKGNDVYEVYFTTNFDMSGAKVYYMSSVNETDPRYELTHYFDKVVPVIGTGMDVIVDIREERVETLSYLIKLTDTEGQKHWYYFRVDYGA